MPLVRGHVPKEHCLKGLTEAAPGPPQAPRGMLSTCVRHRPAKADDGQTRGAAGPLEGPRRLEARGPQGLCDIPWTAVWTTKRATTHQRHLMGPWLPAFHTTTREKKAHSLRQSPGLPEIPQQQRACPGPASPAADGHLCSAAAGSRSPSTGRDRTICDKVRSHELLRWAPAGTVLGGGGKANHRLVSCRVLTPRDGVTSVASAAALNAGRPFLVFPPPVSVAGFCFVHS